MSTCGQSWAKRKKIKTGSPDLASLSVDRNSKLDRPGNDDKLNSNTSPTTNRPIITGTVRQKLIPSPTAFAAQTNSHLRQIGSDPARQTTNDNAASRPISPDPDFQAVTHCCGIYTPNHNKVFGIANSSVVQKGTLVTPAVRETNASANNSSATRSGSTTTNVNQGSALDRPGTEISHSIISSKGNISGSCACITDATASTVSLSQHPIRTAVKNDHETEKTSPAPASTGISPVFSAVVNSVDLVDNSFSSTACSSLKASDSNQTLLATDDRCLNVSDINSPVVASETANKTVIASEHSLNITNFELNSSLGVSNHSSAISQPSTALRKIEGSSTSRLMEPCSSVPVIASSSTLNLSRLDSFFHKSKERSATKPRGGVSSLEKSLSQPCAAPTTRISGCSTPEKREKIVSRSRPAKRTSISNDVKLCSEKDDQASPDMPDIVKGHSKECILKLSKDTLKQSAFIDPRTGVILLTSSVVIMLLLTSSIILVYKLVSIQAMIRANQEQSIQLAEQSSHRPEMNEDIFRVKHDRHRMNIEEIELILQTHLDLLDKVNHSLKTLRDGMFSGCAGEKTKQEGE